MVDTDVLTPVPLGRTGLHIARVSLGTVKLGRDQGVKYPTPARIPSDDEALALLAEARALGINLLDTAPAYGRSEARLGELVGNDPAWLVCTKVGEIFEDGQSRHDFSADHTRRSLEQSMQRLRRDVLDVVLIHSNGDDLAILEQHGVWGALQEFKRAGHIRAIGMSHKSVAGGRLALDMGADVLMATLNPDEQTDAQLITDAARAGCGILVKKALSSGHGRSADLALAAGHPGVHSIVVGTTNLKHLRENVAVVASTPLRQV